MTFRQDGECLGGTLTDANIPNGPKTGPIFGRVNGNTITFSFRYTYTGATQGTRTFTGTNQQVRRGVRQLERDGDGGAQRDLVAGGQGRPGLSGPATAPEAIMAA